MRRSVGLVWGGALVLLVAACDEPPKSPTPYQPFTNQEGAIPGGYIDRDLGHGEHVITFRGNIYTLWEDVLAYARHRADEVCPGGYVPLSEEDVSAETQEADR